MATTKTSTAKTSAAKEAATVWTDEERAAMQDERPRTKDRLAPRPGRAERAEGEADVPRQDRRHADGGSRHGRADPRDRHDRGALARSEDVLRDAGVRQGRQGRSASSKPASKFKVRYSTFGFQPDARLDDGEMWPVAFAVTELTPRVEARIAELVKKAAS